MRRRGFTLIELICVCALIGILLAAAEPAVGRQILLARARAEAGRLRAMAQAARASFESDDLEGTNLAALPGSVPAGVDCTSFSPSTDPAFMPPTTNAFDWFAKLARQMGYTPLVGVAPTQALQPGTANILVNPSGNTRVMLAGPENEAAQQRFLLISLAAPPGELALPPLPDAANSQDPADLALFNDTWNTDWNSPTASLPPSWLAGLTPAQAQAWTASHRLWLLCVERIVCPKFTVTVNDTHPSDNCYVAYNLNGQNGTLATIAADSGATVIPGIFYGRVIQAYRGSAPPPAAQLFAQFTLRDNNEITLQD